MMELGLPKDQILRDDPNVWITSFWGWSPEGWGCVSFSDKSRVPTVLSEMPEGGLWVIYVTKNAPKPTPREQKGKIIGIYELSHETGHAAEFIEPELCARYPGKWPHGVRATRAWTIEPKDRLKIEDYAEDSYYNENGKDRGRSIGRYGRKLTKAEALKLLDFEVREAKIYNGDDIEDTSPIKLKDVSKPSKPGPAVEGLTLVDRSKNTRKELYFLELRGDIAAILGMTKAEIDGRKLIKVGLSFSPETREKVFNAALPDGAFHWKVLRSTLRDKHKLYSHHEVAVVGEQAMIEYFQRNSNSAESKGHEFFLASEQDIENAWQVGRERALEEELK